MLAPSSQTQFIPPRHDDNRNRTIKLLVSSLLILRPLG